MTDASMDLRDQAVDRYDAAATKLERAAAHLRTAAGPLPRPGGSSRLRSRLGRPRPHRHRPAADGRQRRRPCRTIATLIPLITLDSKDMVEWAIPTSKTRVNLGSGAFQ